MSENMVERVARRIDVVADRIALHADPHGDDVKFVADLTVADALREVAEAFRDEVRQP